MCLFAFLLWNKIWPGTPLGRTPTVEAVGIFFHDQKSDLAKKPLHSLSHRMESFLSWCSRVNPQTTIGWQTVPLGCKTYSFWTTWGAGFWQWINCELLCFTPFALSFKLSKTNKKFRNCKKFKNQMLFPKYEGVLGPHRVTPSSRETWMYAEVPWKLWNGILVKSYPKEFKGRKK